MIRALPSYVLGLFRTGLFLNYFEKIGRSLSLWLPSKKSGFATTVTALPERLHSGVPVQAYLLKGWPELDAQFKTAMVYRAVSFMGTHPVSWDWLCNSLSKNTALAQALLKHLDQLDVLEVLQVRFEPFEGHVSQAIAYDMVASLAAASGKAAKLPTRGVWR